MTPRSVHVFYAPEDAPEIAPLITALASRNVKANADPEGCALFLACCSSRGTYAAIALRSAREIQLANHQERVWLVAVQFGAAPLPSAFDGLPVVALHGDWAAGLAHLTALLPVDETKRSRTGVQTTNVLAPDVLFENKPSDSNAEMTVTASGDIVGDSSVTFRNG